MKINLLQKRHDFITEKFINGFISLDDFLMIEDIFIKNEKLYTIYLNWYEEAKRLPNKKRKWMYRNFK